MVAVWRPRLDEQNTKRVSLFATFCTAYRKWAAPPTAVENVDFDIISDIISLKIKTNI